MVVGDDDQSIYGWRGADIRNILDFEKRFSAGAKVVRLEENYRSTPQILDLANVAISPNTERRGKTLRSTRPPGERATVVGASTIATRRTTSSRRLRSAVARPADESPGQSLGGGSTLRDFAVLYRTNAQSRSLEESLRRSGFAYRLVGAVRFYDRREIRDLMGYLKLIANPNDDEAFRRAIAAPKRGIGDTSIDTLAAAAHAERMPLLAASVRPRSRVVASTRGSHDARRIRGAHGPMRERRGAARRRSVARPDRRHSVRRAPQRRAGRAGPPGQRARARRRARRKSSLTTAGKSVSRRSTISCSARLSSRASTHWIRTPMPSR